MSTAKNSSTNEYTIPDEYFMSKDVIAEQLEILENLFPNQKSATTSEDEQKSTTPAKKAKTDDNMQNNNNKPTSAPLSVDNKHKKITAEQLKISLNDTLKKTETSKRSNDQNDGASTSKQAALSSNTDVIKTPSKAALPDPRPLKNIHEYINVVLPKGNMAKKLEQAAPYNFFLTTITASKQTHNEPLSITFQGKCLRF